MLLAARRSPCGTNTTIPVAASHELGFASVAVLLTERPADERALLMCHGGLVQRVMQWPYGPRSQFARRAGRRSGGADARNSAGGGGPARSGAGSRVG